MSSPLTPGGRGAAKAFTLIELLTVIAIIGVLAGITFSVVSGVKERAAIGKARSELAIIAAALESYKKQYGDYPQAGNSNAPADVAATPEITYSHSQSLLVSALAGTRGPTMAVIPQAKRFIEESKHQIAHRDYTETIGTITYNRRASAILDPWGRRYLYAYRSSSNPADWKYPSYVLYSAGPDGKYKSNDPDSAGKVDRDDADNADNIYANNF